MPDSSKYQIGVEIGATGAENFKKQVDGAVSSLEGMKKAFVQVPKVNLGDRITGVPSLKKDVDDAVASASKLSGAFVQLPSVDASGIVENFRKIPPVISQSVASLASYKKAVDGLRNTAGIKVPVSLVSLEQLDAKLSAIRNKLQTTTDPKIFSKLQAEAKKTETAIRALEGTVNKSGKTLGNVAPGANQAGAALVNLGRVAQDAPFGFIGIQNNINPLLESFQRLKASTGSTGASLKALASGLTGAAGIGLAISVVTSLITAAVQKYGSLGNAINSLFGGVSNLAQANRDLAKSFAESEGSVAGEVATINALVGIAQNKALSDATRQQALDKLNKEYDKYLPKLTLETVETNKVNEAVKKLTASLIRQAKIKGVEDLISKETGKQAELLANDLTDNLSIIDEVTAGLQSFLNPVGSAGANVQFERIAKGAKVTADEVGKSEERITRFNQALEKLLVTEAEAGTLQLPDPVKPKTIDLLSKQIAALERIKKVQQEIAEIPTIDKKIANFDTTGLTDAQIEELTGKKKIEQALKEVEQLIATSEKLYQLKNVKINLDLKKGIIDASSADEARKQLRKELDDIFQLQATVLEGTVRVKPVVAIDRADLTQPEIQSKIAKELGLDKTLPLNYSATIQVQIAGADTRRAMKDLEAIQDEFKKTVDDIINRSLQSGAEAIGEGIGNAFSGEGLKGLFAPFLNVIADSITQLGKATIAYGLAMKVVQEALKKTFKNPYVAIAAGIAAVAVGQVLKNKARASQPKFESGGIISGPNSGYPVLLHGTEAIVPLDNNRFPFGVNGGGGVNNGLGDVVGRIRGRDIELVNRRATTSRRRI